MRISDWSSDVCSSDLLALSHIAAIGEIQADHPLRDRRGNDHLFIGKCRSYRIDAVHKAHAGHRSSGDQRSRRSEEHTSELQSLMRSSYAVFCLKKKNNKISHIKHYLVSSQITTL